MKVIVKNEERCYECAVTEDRIRGTKYVVPVAYKSEYCKACQSTHTHFKDVTFDVILLNKEGPLDWALVADTIEYARLLPGFKEEI